MAQAQNSESSSRVGAAPSSKQAPAVAPVESAGVDNLIDRLRDEGIAQGHSQAQALVTAAQKQASDIVATAQREADTILVKAKEEAGKLKAAGENAIALAMRDTILSLEGQIIKDFRNKLVQLIKAPLADPAFLQRLILEVASKAAPASTGKRVELLLPAEIVSLEDLQRKPEQATPGTLMHFVLSLGGGMLREGISFGVADDGEAGIRASLVEDDVRIDLTESAISELLLRHMLPRFRALLRGKVVIDRTDTKQPDATKRSPRPTQ
jgi:V/A-type H+/Na+-transporting ATPase subunit E